MVKFKQINRFQYLAEEHEELVDYVKKILEELSGSSKDFIEQSNRELFHNMLSRVVAREFFKQVKIADNVLTVVIDLNYQDTVYTTSVGIMPDPEDNIRVKYVDSYYIR